MAKTSVVTTGLIFAVALSLAGAANASVLKPDLRAVNAPSALSSHGGDFDGDGRADTIALVNEADTGRVAVHVRLDRADGVRDIRVTSMVMDANATPDLRIVTPGQYALDCGTFSDACEHPSVETRADSLLMGLNGGTSVLMHWQDDHFEQDFVRTDATPMTALTRALSALYAVNR